MTEILTVQQLSFTYPTQVHATLHDVALSIAPGEVVALLGPSGAGKSTTQKVLLKLLHGYHGEVRVLGKDLREWGQDYYRHIGVSFELPNHYPKLSAYENMQLFAHLHGVPDSRILPLLEQVGLAEHAHRRVAQFSKGMQMRLMLTRSLLHQPRLLFLDEPTSGLDPNNAQRIIALVQAYRQAGNAVFLTTHDMTVATQLCDRVALMLAGRIVVCDAPQTLMRAHGKRRVLVTYAASTEAESSLTYDAPLDDLATDRHFQDILAHQHIISMHTQEATLADVFTQLTGEVLT